MAITDPDAGPYSFQGEQGVSQFVVVMANEHAEIIVTSDGAAVGSAKPGQVGAFHIVCNQQSNIYGYLLSAYNAKTARQLNGDVSTFFGMAISVRDATTNRGHILSGVAVSKPPDLPRGMNAVDVTWILPAANIVNM